MRDYIIGLYQQYLGRTPSEGEIQSHLGNPGGQQGIYQAIAESDEAKARQQAQNQPFSMANDYRATEATGPIPPGYTGPSDAARSGPVSFAEMTDPSRQDTRTQEQRIAAGDSPVGSTMYTSPTAGRIDVRQGINPAEIEAELRAEAARWGAQGMPVTFDPTMVEDVLRNTGYQTGGVSKEQAMATARAIIAQRAQNTPGGGSGGGTERVYAGGSSSFNERGSQPGGSWFDQNGGDGTAPYSYTPVTFSSWTPGDVALPAAYSFADFVQPAAYQAPTADSVRNSEAFKFRLDEGIKALERSGASKGKLFTQTPQALIDYGQGLASTEYGNEDARQFRNWQGNRQNAMDAWTMNRGNAQSQFDNGVTRTGLARLIEGDRRNMFETDRTWATNRDTEMWNRDRTKTNDAYAIFDNEDQKYFDRLYRAAALGRPA